MHSLTGAHAQVLEKCKIIEPNYILYTVWLRSRSVHTADGARLWGGRTMHTPSIAFRHLCRKPVLGACEPCSDRDEQVGPALFVQGTQHCALLTPISGLCIVCVSVTHSPSPSTKATQRGVEGVCLSHPCVKEADTTVLFGTRKTKNIWPLSCTRAEWKQIPFYGTPWRVACCHCPSSVHSPPSLPPSLPPPPPPRLSLSLSLSLKLGLTCLRY